MDTVAEPQEHPFEPTQRLLELKAKLASSSSRRQPARLALSKIQSVPELFQPRGGIDERHVSELARAIRNVGELDPVTVIQVGDDDVVIDGHHRLAAYEVARWQGAVPVSYFGGTLEEAVVVAGAANSQAKLPMSTRERQDYAWRLTLLGGYSKAETVKASGASSSSIANMRRAMRALGDEAYDFPSWWKAWQAARGRSTEMDDAEREDWKRELADRWADTLAKAFDQKMAHNPEVAAMALATFFGRRLDVVAEELLGHIDDAVLEGIMRDRADTNTDEF